MLAPTLRGTSPESAWPASIARRAAGDRSPRPPGAPAPRPRAAARPAAGEPPGRASRRHRGPPGMVKERRKLPRPTPAPGAQPRPRRSRYVFSLFGRREEVPRHFGNGGLPGLSDAFGNDDPPPDTSGNVPVGRSDSSGTVPGRPADVSGTLAACELPWPQRRAALWRDRAAMAGWSAPRPTRVAQPIRRRVLQHRRCRAAHAEQGLDALVQSGVH
jgi:hypothetical protein